MTYQNEMVPGGGSRGKWDMWRIIAISLGAVVVVLCILFFAVPLVKVPVQVVENYTETEYKDEEYNTFYVTITDPAPMNVYQYRGMQAAPQEDDFEFIPKLSGAYVMRFSTDYVRLVKYGRRQKVF